MYRTDYRGGYPGPIAPIPKSILDDFIRQARPFVLESFPPLLSSLFEADADLNADGFASLYCSQRSDVPHFDFASADEPGLAAVWYVGVDERMADAVGTAFFKEHRTGAEVFRTTREGDRYWERVNRIRGDTKKHFSKTFEAKFVPEEAIVFPVNVLHGLSEWGHGLRMSCDPRHGRMAISMFFQIKKDEGDVRFGSPTQMLDKREALESYGMPYPSDIRPMNPSRVYKNEILKFGNRIRSYEGDVKALVKEIETVLNSRQKMEVFHLAIKAQHLSISQELVSSGACWAADSQDIKQLLSETMNWCTVPTFRGWSHDMSFFKTRWGVQDFMRAEPLLSLIGAKFFMKMLGELSESRSFAKAGGDGSVFAEFLHDFSIKVCEPFVQAIVECDASSGRKGPVDASPAAAVLAQIGATSTLRLLHDAGFNITSPVGAQSFPLDTRRSMFHSSLATESAAHAAAYAGQRDTLDFLVEVDPSVMGKGAGRMSFTPNDIMWYPTTMAKPELSPSDKRNLGAGWPARVDKAYENDFFSPLPTTGCDFDVVEASVVLADPRGFVKKYILAHQPVLVRGLVYEDPKLQPMLERFSRDEMLREGGDRIFTVSEVAHPTAYRAEEQPVFDTLRGFVEKHIEDVSEDDYDDTYIFTNFYLRDGSGADGDYQSISWSWGDLKPSFMDPKNFQNVMVPHDPKLPIMMELGIGGPRTGAQFHFHGAAWNALAYGRKAWAVNPKSVGVNSRESALSFLEREGKTMEYTKCIQGGGDVIVIPDQWSHLTMNLQTSVGLACEFDLKE